MNRLNKLISTIVLACFLLNTTASDYALALAPAKGSLETESRILAIAQEALALKRAQPVVKIVISEPAEKFQPDITMGGIEMTYVQETSVEALAKKAVDNEVAENDITKKLKLLNDKGAKLAEFEKALAILKQYPDLQKADEDLITISIKLMSETSIAERVSSIKILSSRSQTLIIKLMKNEYGELWIGAAKSPDAQVGKACYVGKINIYNNGVLDPCGNVLDSDPGKLAEKLWSELLRENRDRGVFSGAVEISELKRLAKSGSKEDLRYIVIDFTEMNKLPPSAHEDRIWAVIDNLKDPADLLDMLKETKGWATNALSEKLSAAILNNKVLAAYLNQSWKIHPDLITARLINKNEMVVMIRSDGGSGNIIFKFYLSNDDKYSWKIETEKINVPPVEYARAVITFLESAHTSGMDNDLKAKLLTQYPKNAKNEKEVFYLLEEALAALRSPTALLPKKIQSLRFNFLFKIALNLITGDRGEQIRITRQLTRLFNLLDKIEGVYKHSSVVHAADSAWVRSKRPDTADSIKNTRERILQLLRACRRNPDTASKDIGRAIRMAKQIYAQIDHGSKISELMEQTEPGLCRVEILLDLPDIVNRAGLRLWPEEPVAVVGTMKLARIEPPSVKIFVPDIEVTGAGDWRVQQLAELTEDERLGYLRRIDIEELDYLLFWLENHAGYKWFWIGETDITALEKLIRQVKDEKIKNTPVPVVQIDVQIMEEAADKYAGSLVNEFSKDELKSLIELYKHPGIRNSIKQGELDKLIDILSAHNLPKDLRWDGLPKIRAIGGLDTFKKAIKWLEIVNRDEKTMPPGLRTAVLLKISAAQKPPEFVKLAAASSTPENIEALINRKTAAGECYLCFPSDVKTMLAYYEFEQQVVETIGERKIIFVKADKTELTVNMITATHYSDESGIYILLGDVEWKEFQDMKGSLRIIALGKDIGFNDSLVPNDSKKEFIRAKDEVDKARLFSAVFIASIEAIAATIAGEKPAEQPTTLKNEAAAAEPVIVEKPKTVEWLRENVVIPDFPKFYLPDVAGQNGISDSIKAGSQEVLAVFEAIRSPLRIITERQEALRLLKEVGVPQEMCDKCYEQLIGMVNVPDDMFSMPNTPKTPVPAAEKSPAGFVMSGMFSIESLIGFAKKGDLNSIADDFAEDNSRPLKSYNDDRVPTVVNNLSDANKDRLLDILKSKPLGWATDALIVALQSTVPAAPARMAFLYDGNKLGWADAARIFKTIVKICENGGDESLTIIDFAKYFSENPRLTKVDIKKFPAQQIKRLITRGLLDKNFSVPEDVRLILKTTFGFPEGFDPYMKDPLTGGHYSGSELLKDAPAPAAGNPIVAKAIKLAQAELDNPAFPEKEDVKIKTIKLLKEMQNELQGSETLAQLTYKWRNKAANTGRVEGYGLIRLLKANSMLKLIRNETIKIAIMPEESAGIIPGVTTTSTAVTTTPAEPAPAVEIARRAAATAAPGNLNENEQAKLRSAQEALKRLKEALAARGKSSKPLVIGLGSGTTIWDHFLPLLVKAVKGGEIDKNAIVGIATSPKTVALIGDNIKLVKLNNFTAELPIDIAIDGADEICMSSWAAIKGGGGALTDEKQVLDKAKKIIIIVDRRKIVDTLGKFLLPLEVEEEKAEAVMERLKLLGGMDPKVRPISPGNTKPFRPGDRPDCVIIDVNFNPIKNPAELAAKLKNIEGVVTQGIFFTERVPDLVIVGNKEGGTTVYAQEVASRIDYTQVPFEDGKDAAKTITWVANKANSISPNSVPKLDEDKARSAWESAGLLKKSKVKVVYPQRVSGEKAAQTFVLTEAMKKTLRDIKKNAEAKVGSSFDWKGYTEENLEESLRGDEEKVLIVEEEMSVLVVKLLKEKPELFKNVRIYNMYLPKGPNGYRDNMSESEKSVYQSRAFMIAMLVRLYKENDPYVKPLLEDMLEGRLPVGVSVSDFINNIPEKETEKNVPDVERLSSFLVWKVNLIEVLGKQLRLLEEFVWSAA